MSAAEAGPALKRARTDPVWNGVTIADSTTSNPRWTCKYCKYAGKGSATRVRAHFLGSGGVSQCQRPGDAAQRELYDAFLKTLKDSEEKKAAKSRSDQGKKNEVRGPLDAWVSSQPLGKKELDSAIASFVYETNQAFMITKHPAFQHLLKAALHAKVESYAPPTPYALAGPLLQSAYADMAARGQAWIKEEAKKRGLSFLLDGWSNRRKQALFNCVLAAEGGRSYWLSTVSAVGKTKTKGYMTDLILDQIRPLGSSVVLVVMDGALKCTHQMLEKHGLATHVCLPHSVNLFFTDVASPEKRHLRPNNFFEEQVREWEQLATWLGNRPALLDRLREKCNLALVKACESRFGTYFLVGARLLQMREGLVAVMRDPAFEAWVSTLDTTSAKGTARGWRDVIVGGRFWREAQETVIFFKHVFILLRKFDQEAAYLEDVVPMLAQTQAALENHHPPHQKASDVLEAVEAARRICHDLGGTCCLLSPSPPPRRRLYPSCRRA